MLVVTGAAGDGPTRTQAAVDGDVPAVPGHGSGLNLGALDGSGAGYGVGRARSGGPCPGGA